MIQRCPICSPEGTDRGFDRGDSLEKDAEPGRSWVWSDVPEDSLTADETGGSCNDKISSIFFVIDPSCPFLSR